MCEHLLVDEYQDINTAQFRLIELLSRNSRNGLFVVGDDARAFMDLGVAIRNSS